MLSLSQDVYLGVYQVSLLQFSTISSRRKVRAAALHFLKFLPHFLKEKISYCGFICPTFPSFQVISVLWKALMQNFGCFGRAVLQLLDAAEAITALSQQFLTSLAQTDFFFNFANRTVGILAENSLFLPQCCRRGDVLAGSCKLLPGKEMEHGTASSLAEGTKNRASCIIYCDPK